MTRQIVVEIVGEKSKFSGTMKEATSEAEGFGGKLKGIGKDVGKGAALGLGIGAFGAVTSAIGAVVGVMDEASQSIRRQQELAAQTEAGIKSTGGAANVTAQHILDYGDALEKNTGLEQENVQAGQNMLLTFTNVKNAVGAGNDIFDQATTSIADMATKMAGGAAPSAEQMQTASIQLGKALNDPIKGISALSKVGVTFTEGQKAAIEQMVASGDTMGAQKIILKELQTEFGGAAEAFGNTDAGKIAKGNNQMGDAFEKLARPLEHIGVVALPILADALTFVVDVLGNVWQAIEPIVTTVSTALIPVFQKLGPIATKVFDAISEAVHDLQPVFEVVFAAIGAVVGVFVNIFKTEMDIVSNVLGAVGDVFRGLSTIVGAVFGSISSVVKGAINGVVGIVNAVIGSLNAVQFHVDLGPLGKVDFDGLNLPTIPVMHSGGVVPGSPGTDVLTMLQAGETVSPAGKGGGQTIVINIESFIGSDSDIDRFADKVALRLLTA